MVRWQNHTPEDKFAFKQLTSFEGKLRKLKSKRKHSDHDSSDNDVTSKRVRNTTAGGKRKRDVQSESDGAASARRVTKKRDKASAKRREATPPASDAKVRPNDATTKGIGVSDAESTEDDRPAVLTKQAKGKARY
jgi:condensin complex subunit 3